jgi:hypothetical protein
MATQLASASRDAAKKTPETITRLVDTARQLRDATIALEDSMRSGQTAEQLAESSIDPAVAHQLMATARTIAMETTGLIRSSANVSANPDNGQASDEMKRSTRQVTEVRPLHFQSSHPSSGDPATYQSYWLPQSWHSGVREGYPVHSNSICRTRCGSNLRNSRQPLRARC